MDKIIGIRKLIMCLLGLVVFTLISLHNKDVNYLALGSGILCIVGPIVIANFGEWLSKWKGLK